jgi:biotin carboxylase
MIPSLMILGAGPLQTSAIHEARALGIRSVSLDHNPEAVGLRLCDKAHVADILNPDVVAEIARQERIDGIMTLCTDAPISTVAAVGRMLSLTVLSEDAAARATDKRLMREAFAEYGAPSPQAVQVESPIDARLAAERLGYPVALKIGRGSGSRGIYRIENEQDLRDGYDGCREYQRDGALLVEEWVEGGEVSVEGYCTDSECHIVAITDKLVFPGRYPVEAGHCQPSHHSGLTQREIERAVISGVRALGLTWCMIHAELKVSPKGPRLIEIGARLGGDRISTHLTPLSTGVNMVRTAILLSLGERVDAPKLWNRGSCVRYFDVKRTGKLHLLDGVRSLYGITGAELIYPASERDGTLNKGFQIGTIRSSLDRYGHVVYSGDTREQALERCDQALESLRFEFVDGEIRNGIGHEIVGAEQVERPISVPMAAKAHSAGI